MAETREDPWSNGSPAAEAVAVANLACPHCGTELTPHHDAVGSLHCYDSRCVNCCFLPPDELSDGSPQAKFEARPCPMQRAQATAGAGF
jgi:hypothetical protein